MKVLFNVSFPPSVSFFVGLVDYFFSWSTRPICELVY